MIDLKATTEDAIARLEAVAKRAREFIDSELERLKGEAREAAAVLPKLRELEGLDQVLRNVPSVVALPVVIGPAGRSGMVPLRLELQGYSQSGDFKAPAPGNYHAVIFFVLREELPR